MTSEFMRNLLSKDEKITVEYKSCQYGIQEDVYETVCSFSNRYGGYIIMGAEDDGTVEMILDNGWQLSFRIHSASTKVEPSLKFDVQFISMPVSVCTIKCVWK